MKSILKGAALLSAAALIASCDSSSGGGSNFVPTPPAPQASVTGSAIKGVITGASVTVTNTDGTVVGRGTANNGVYDVTYEANATAPLIITITGGSTVCDFDRPNTTNDCATGDAATPFASFGQPYDLPADFVVRTIEVAVTNGNTNNSNAATELAVLEALELNGGAVAGLTAASSTQALNAIKGLIENITGIDLGDQSITAIGAADINSNGGAGASAAQLAISAFNSAVLSLQADGESLTATFARIAALVTVDAATGNITATGTQLAQISAAISQGLQTVAASSGNGQINSAIGTANSQTTTFTNIGGGSVTVLPPPAPGSTAPVDLTKAFVATLGAVLGDLLESTGAESFGGSDNQSATEAFAAELDAVAAVTSGNATRAFNALDTALKTAAGQVSAENPTVQNTAEEGDANDGVTFTLTRNTDGSLSVTGATAVWPKSGTGDNLVTITQGSAAATSTAANRFSIPEVTLTSVKTVSGAADVTQTFVGSLTISANAETATNSDATLTGTITTSATGATSFGINASLTNYAESATGADTGAYSVAFTFESAGSPNVSATFNGTIGAAAQNYAITSPSGTISGIVTRPAGSGDSGAADKVTLSDGSATLTLTLLQGNFNGGAFTVGDVDTGSLNTSGLVTFSDQSFVSLPAIIF